jgi:hypothetical protein
MISSQDGAASLLQLRMVFQEQSQQGFPSSAPHEPSGSEAYWDVGFLILFTDRFYKA